MIPWGRRSARRTLPTPAVAFPKAREARGCVTVRRGGKFLGRPSNSWVEFPLSRQAAARLRGMSCPLPCVLLALMGLLFARTMAWTSSGKTHPELVNNLYSEYWRGLLSGS